MTTDVTTDAALAEPLAYTEEVARVTAPIYERLKEVIPPLEWPVHAPYIAAIQKLKQERKAIILAHNYQTPEIFHSVADICGDSLRLAHQAVDTDAKVIVMGGVRFMAETAKILNPDKTVLIASQKAGCSLASSITAADVQLLRERYPNTPVVSYVNTSAAVKAVSDICCTSANAVKIVESLGVDRVIFLPDEYLGRYVAQHTEVEVILWQGHCEVHERFSANDVRAYRRQYAGIQVLAHPECPPDVLEEADFVGSTSGMIRYVGHTRPRQVVMVTECSMSDNVAVEYPDIRFVRPCALCPHMKRITLPGIYSALKEMKYEIDIPEETVQHARLALERMLDVS